MCYARPTDLIEMTWMTWMTWLWAPKAKKNQIWFFGRDQLVIIIYGKLLVCPASHPFATYAKKCPIPRKGRLPYRVRRSLVDLRFVSKSKRTSNIANTNEIKILRAMFDRKKDEPIPTAPLRHAVDKFLEKDFSDIKKMNGVNIAKGLDIVKSCMNRYKKRKLLDKRLHWLLLSGIYADADINI